MLFPHTRSPPLKRWSEKPWGWFAGFLKSRLRSEPKERGSEKRVVLKKNYTSRGSRPGKPNQRKGQNEKFIWISPIFCVNSGVLPRENKHFCHISNFCSGMPPKRFMNWPFFGLVCRGDSWISWLSLSWPRGYLETLECAVFRRGRLWRGVPWESFEVIFLKPLKVIFISWGHF